MSLIDWSDPDEMLGLLDDYVADEVVTSRGDGERQAFLEGLSGELRALVALDVGSAAVIARELGQIRAAQPQEFDDDPVMEHLDACLEELHRIERLHQA